MCHVPEVGMKPRLLWVWGRVPFNTFEQPNKSLCETLIPQSNVKVAMSKPRSQGKIFGYGLKDLDTRKTHAQLVTYMYM